MGSISESYNEKHIIALALLLGTTVIAYGPTFLSIIEIWARSDTFAHGFLIVPIVIYLIWQKKPRLINAKIRYNYSAIPAVLFILLMWLLGSLGHILALQQFSVVALFVVFVWLLLGSEVVGILRFPLLYLFFAVPFGEFLVPYLQDFTAHFVVSSLRAVGIPVFWEGRFFYLPSGNFEVAKACSGIRYLIASVTLGVLYAYINFITTKKRIIFVIFSVLVPLVANGVRAFGIVLLVHFTDREHGIGVDHLIYGWIFFGFVMFLLFGIGHLFSDAHSGKILVEKDNKQTRETVPSINRWGLIPIYAILMISLIIPASIFAIESKPLIKSDLKYSVPGGVEGWSGPRIVQVDPQWGPTNIGANVTNLYEYKKDEKVIHLYVVNYFSQKRGEEMINSQNVQFNGKHWRRLNSATKDVRFYQDEISKVRFFKIRSDQTELLLWSWYIIDEKITASSLTAKLYEIAATLFSHNNESMIVTLATEDMEVNSLENFSRQFSPRLVLGGSVASVDGFKPR